MRAAATIPLLVLLFSMSGAQTKSTQTEVQPESQSPGAAAAAAAAAAEVSTQLDVSAELRELRDMVVELRTIVAQQGKTLSFTQNELQNTKSLLYKATADIDELKENTAVQDTDLTTVKTEVKNLIKDNAALATEIDTLKMANAALETRLSASETEVENLKMETAAQEEEITTLMTRLSASETEVENLKMETAAQDAELTAVKTRLAATESDVVNLEKEITDQPKVAFSAGLTNSGYIQAGNTDMNLVFTKPITNVGQAYSSTTGFFTAPVRGVYYFRFIVMDALSSRHMSAILVKNGAQVMRLWEYGTDGGDANLSGGATLQLEEGDVVNMRLPAGHRLYDDADNRSIFCGFLLFPL